MDIAQIFTKIRNKINDREEELLMLVDTKYNDSFADEDFFKNSEKMPNKIKLSLDECKLINNNNDKNIPKIINDCIKIENNIKDINISNENIKKYNDLNNLEIDFFYEEEKILEDIKYFGEIIKNYKFSIIDSNEKNEIIKWIKEKTKKNEVAFKLLFKMSENGTNSEDFHRYSNNKGSTLTLIKTTKNKRFGGYTPLDWKNEGDTIYDETNQTFIFSLNLMKKYDLNEKKAVAIICRKDNGPNFGNCDFGLKQDMKQGICYSNQLCSFLLNNNLELIDEGEGESHSFETEEFEVYQVL